MSPPTNVLAADRDQERLPRLLRLIGTGGALLGVLVGALDVAFGPSIRSWVGDKQNTTGLGTATILLSLVALASVVGSTSLRSPSTGQRLAVAAALIVTAGICFTTTGRLWYAPGTLLILAGLLAVAWARRAGDILATVERNWLLVLTTVLAAFYILLGSVTWGVVGALGIVGGLLIFAALVSGQSRRIAIPILILGTLPFAVVTWWSVVTPVMALLVLLLGGLAVARATAKPARA